MSASTDPSADPEGYTTGTYWLGGLATTDSTNGINYITPGQMLSTPAPSGAQLGPELLRAMQEAEWYRQYAKLALDEYASLLKKETPLDIKGNLTGAPAPTPEPPKNASAYRGWFK